MVTVQNLILFVTLAAVQAVLLGGQALVMGWNTGDPALFWAAGLTFAIKGAVIPLFLRYIIRRIKVMRVVDSTMTTKVQLLIAVVLVLLAHWATGSLSALGGASAETLPVALALVLIGVFLMVSRRVALTQVIGLLVIENGLFLAALATADGLPVLVDAGIIFDVLVTAVVTGLFVWRINATFESIDTVQLRRLRG
jgi:hydrogenase-4 component E